MKPPTAPADSTVARLCADEAFEPDQSGAYSADKILERLVAARDLASKASTRFTIVSFLLVVFYIAKTADLRTDIVLFNQRIFELPYGAFLFCLLAQGAMCISILKGFEEELYDQQIGSVCLTTWPSQSESAYRTFPKIGSFFTSALEFSESRDLGKFVSFIHLLALFTSLITAFTALVSPVVIGIFCLIDWRRQMAHGDTGLQFYSLLGVTILSLLWVLNYFLVSGAKIRQSAN